MYEDQSCRRNASGCPDPTAYRAITRAQDEQEAVARLAEVRRIVFAVCKLAGLWADLKLTDKRTGASL